jgi:hypothetical protein
MCQRRRAAGIRDARWRRGADDRAVAREEDEVIGKPCLPGAVETRNEPRDISRELALERIGCNVRAANMPHGEMVNLQLSSFSVRHFCLTKRIKNIPRSEDRECRKKETESSKKCM